MMTSLSGSTIFFANQFTSDYKHGTELWNVPHGEQFVPITLMILGLIGTGVQLGVTGRKKA
jgi:hypothetical protein